MDDKVHQEAQLMNGAQIRYTIRANFGGGYDDVGPSQYTQTINFEEGIWQNDLENRREWKSKTVWDTRNTIFWSSTKN